MWQIKAVSKLHHGMNVDVAQIHFFLSTPCSKKAVKGFCLHDTDLTCSLRNRSNVVFLKDLAYEKSYLRECGIDSQGWFMV